MVNRILVHYWDRVSGGCSGWYPIFWNGPKATSVSEQIHLKLVSGNSRNVNLFSQFHLCYCCELKMVLMKAFAVWCLLMLFTPHIYTFLVFTSRQYIKNASLNSIVWCVSL
jgi:hypothetical protein